MKTKKQVFFYTINPNIYLQTNAQRLHYIYSGNLENHSSVTKQQTLISTISHPDFRAYSPLLCIYIIILHCIHVFLRGGISFSISK